MQEIIDKLIYDFQKTIPEEETQLLSAYKEFLLTSIESIKNSQYKWLDKNEESIKAILLLKGEFYTKMSIESKKQELLKDKNMDEIISISTEAYKYAIDIFEGRDVEIKFDVNEKIKMLEHLLSLVENYNKERAKKFVSEGILDLEYILNPKSKLISLRLGMRMRIKEQSKKKMNKEGGEITMQNTSEKFLPIGTIVMLKGGKKRLMVTGFCASQETEQGKMWDYSGCLYPEGILGSNQTALFDHDQIETIYHYGLIDGEEQEFKKKLKEYLENEMQNSIKTETTINDIEETNDVE